MLHRVHGDADMRLPAGHDDDRFDIVARVELAIVLRARRTNAAHVLHALLRRLHAIRVDVTHRHDFHIRHRQKNAHLRKSAAAKTDNAQPNRPSGLTQFHTDSSLCPL